MTEKRFKLIDGIKKGTHSGIWDNQKQHNQGIGDELWLGEVVGMLNEGVILAEETTNLKEENEQLNQQLSDINGQLVMLDNCDNWDYDRMKHTVREIAEIIGYNGTINPKR